MAAPKWLRSTGAAAAIALSSVPMLAALPGVLAAHDALDRELHGPHVAVAAAGGSTADAAMAVVEGSAFRDQ